MLEFGGADDRRCDARLLKQPRERDLGAWKAASGGDLARSVDDREVRLWFVQGVPERIGVRASREALALAGAGEDDGAAVGQAGDLRPVYYAFKRCALFALSFEEILENSTDATATYKNMLKSDSVRITARHSAAGDIVFLDNPSKTAQQAQLEA